MKLNDLNLKIGEEAQIMVRCVEDKDARSCECCVFDNSLLCELIHCSSFVREDGKDVHFEIVMK